MNDIPASIASPYLTEAHLSFDPDEGPSELADFLSARQPSVLLNHGDAEAFGDTVSLGRALRWALEGQTRSFTAVVGFLGGFSPNDKTPEDDPVAIIRHELQEGSSGVDATDENHIGFRLAFGGVSSESAEIAMKAWYWACRWNHSEYGNPDAARAWRDRAIELVQSRDFAALLTSGDGLVEAIPKEELGLGEPLHANDEKAAWNNFCDLVEDAEDQHLEPAGMVFGYLLQRTAEVRVQPHPTLVEEEYEEAIEPGLLHAKLYVVERGKLEDDADVETAAFAGSNNWSRAALAGAPEPGQNDYGNYRNIEVSVAARCDGGIWADEPPAAMQDEPAVWGDDLAGRIGKTARRIFGELPVLGTWTDDARMLPAGLVEKLCDAEDSPWTEFGPPEKGEGEQENDTDTGISTEYAQLLQSLKTVIDRLIDLNLDDTTAEIYQDVLSNRPDRLEPDFLEKLNRAISAAEDKTPGKLLDAIREADIDDPVDILKEKKPLFGGLCPSHYQLDGALRLMGMLKPRPKQTGVDSRRGAFLTDEAGLGKTLVAEMTAAFIIAEKLDARIPKRSQRPEQFAEIATPPLRVSIVVPARLRGKMPREGQDATGWYAHVERIRQAARWCLVRKLDSEDLELVSHYFSALEFRVFSHASLSRSLATDELADHIDVHPDDFGPKQGPLPKPAYNSSTATSEHITSIPKTDDSKPADDLYWLATSEVVIIDESHNFRNDSSRATRSLRYALSLPIPGDDTWDFEIPEDDGEASPESDGGAPMRRVLCLSATPFNNRVDDIVTQIGHFDQYQDWKKPYESNPQGQLFAETDELFDALRTWKLAQHPEMGEELDRPMKDIDNPPRQAFDVITRHVYHHLESGRSLRVSEDLRQKREQEREDVRSRYTDGGPEYEWAGRGGDTTDTNYYQDVFAPAVKWAREQQKGNDYEMSSEERTRIDALLSEMMVQRSRARVIKNVRAHQQRSGTENVQQMFRRPDVPRYPLRLNNPAETGENNSFEARVVEQLSELFDRTKGDDDSGDTTDVAEGLNLFSYEINVRREREDVITDEQTKTGANAVGFQLLNLIKRLQSSPYAFMRSVIRGPMRRALLELSYFEAFVRESIDSDTAGFEWNETSFFGSHPPKIKPALRQLLLDAQEGIRALQREVLDMLPREQAKSRNLERYTEILTDGERTANDSDMLGAFGGFHDGNKRGVGRFGDREFRAGVDELRRALEKLNNDDKNHDWSAGLPEHSWFVDYLRDISRASDEPSKSRLWNDIETSLNWLEEGSTDDFDGIVNELYDGLSVQGTSFSSVRSEFAQWFDEEVEPRRLRGGVQWLENRLRTDGRLRSLLAWLLLQNAARLQFVEDGSDSEIPPDNLLLDKFPAGPKTLLFTEYTDTQEYLVACLTASVAVFEAVPRLSGHDLHNVQSEITAIRRLIVGDEDREGEIRRVVNRLHTDREKLEDFESPVDPEAEWLQEWLNEARNASATDNHDPLARAARAMLKTTARVCSDVTERLWDPEEQQVAETTSDEIGDDPDVVEGRAEPATAESSTTTGDIGDPVDAFSPWYQIEPSDGDEAKLHANRLRDAAEHPVHTLLSTEVLAEGVNLQECGFIAHYDLPWNPTVLIQRNGRIDRRINPRFEQPQQREELADALELAPGERPPFVKPAQVYHATVVPVEPDVEETEAYTHKVRETLFRKLNTIRALFGLSSWPVVINRKQAAEVLSGELEYETPGFRRREDLFNTRSRLEAVLKDVELDDEENGLVTVVAETAQDFIDNLLQDISGIRPDRDESESTDLDHQVSFEELQQSWSNVLAVCLTTWTPYRLDSVPVRSVAEWRHRIGEEPPPQMGIVQATCIVRAPDVTGGIRLLTWTKREVDGKEFVPISFSYSSQFDQHEKSTFDRKFTLGGYYVTLSQPNIAVSPGSKPNPVAPRSPSAFAEDVTTNAAHTLLPDLDQQNGAATELVQKSICASTTTLSSTTAVNSPTKGIECMIPPVVIERLENATDAPQEATRQVLYALAHRLDSVDTLFDQNHVEDGRPYKTPPFDENRSSGSSPREQSANIWLLPTIDSSD